MSGESKPALSDAEAIEVAQTFLRSHGLWPQEKDFAFGGVRTEAESDPSGAITVLAKTVVVRQLANGLPILDSSHQLRVSVGSDRQVTELYDGTTRFESASQSGSDQTIDAGEATVQILARVRAQHPGASLQMERLTLRYVPETQTESVPSQGRRANLRYSGLVRVRSGAFEKLHRYELPTLRGQ